MQLITKEVPAAGKPAAKVPENVVRLVQKIEGSVRSLVSSPTAAFSHDSQLSSRTVSIADFEVVTPIGAVRPPVTGFRLSAYMLSQHDEKSEREFQVRLKRAHKYYNLKIFPRELINGRLGGAQSQAAIEKLLT